jgi:hypothetical protein
MGIVVEFNPDLALRNASERAGGRREESECIPEPLLVGKVYPFLKKGQRNYWLFGEIPLLETDGTTLSLPLASIVILEATHMLKGEEIYTQGTYKIIEVFTQNELRFNGFAKL